jgi:hypothetical protein
MKSENGRRRRVHKGWKLQRWSTAPLLVQQGNKQPLASLKCHGDSFSEKNDHDKKGKCYGTFYIQDSCAKSQI